MEVGMTVRLTSYFTGWDSTEQVGNCFVNFIRIETSY